MNDVSISREERSAIIERETQRMDEIETNRKIKEMMDQVCSCEIQVNGFDETVLKLDHVQVTRDDLQILLDHGVRVNENDCKVCSVFCHKR